MLFGLQLALVSNLASAQTGPEFPELTGRIADQAGLLRRVAGDELTETLRHFERDTKNRMFVATVIWRQGLSVEEYGARLYQHWGIADADRNNSVLLIVSSRERNANGVKILAGSGLQDALDQTVTQAIVQNEILSSFEDGHSAAGIVRGVDAIIAATKGEYDAADGRSWRVDLSDPIWLWALFGLIGILAALVGYFKPKPHPASAHLHGGQAYGSFGYRGHGNEHFTGDRNNGPEDGGDSNNC